MSAPTVMDNPSSLLDANFISTPQCSLEAKIPWFDVHTRTARIKHVQSADRSVKHEAKCHAYPVTDGWDTRAPLDPSNKSNPVSIPGLTYIFQWS
jgi:hypothetical protein